MVIPKRWPDDGTPDLGQLGRVLDGVKVGTSGLMDRVKMFTFSPNLLFISLYLYISMADVEKENR